jgi:hypothetical protein
LLATSVFVTLIALTGAQSTGATAGPRLLGRLAAAMFELDRWTPSHQEDIAASMREGSRGLIEIDGLPVGVSVPPSAVVDGGSGLAQAIASAAGEDLYANGRLAFVDGQGAKGDISLTQPSRWAIGLVEQEDHANWRAFLLIAAAVSLAAFAVVSLTSISGFGGAVRMVAIACALSTVAFMLAWALTQLASHASSSPPDQEVARMLGDCIRIGLQDAVIVGIAAGVLNFALRQFTTSVARVRQWRPAFDETA